ncbi:MAG: 16S rRNA (guanine(966)-N(2))-methyltransferase RsmD [Pseudomonadota bacterium]
MLRIISGCKKGHRLKAIKGNIIRPTADRIRESIFDIISGYITGACVLDLYSGTGAMGLEALSRGAAFSVFVDRHAYALSLIKENIIKLELTAQSIVINRDILKGLGWLKQLVYFYDLVFIDPPYEKDLIAKTLSLLAESQVLALQGRVIAEHSIKETVPEAVCGLTLYDQRKYGSTMISIYSCHDE